MKKNPSDVVVIRDTDLPRNKPTLMRPEFSHTCSHCGEGTNNILLSQKRRGIFCSPECLGAEVV